MSLEIVLLVSFLFSAFFYKCVFLQPEDQVGAILQTPCRYGYNIDHTGRCRKIIVWRNVHEGKERVFPDYNGYYPYVFYQLEDRF